MKEPECRVSRRNPPDIDITGIDVFEKVIPVPELDPGLSYGSSGGDGDGVTSRRGVAAALSSVSGSSGVTLKSVWQSSVCFVG